MNIQQAAIQLETMARAYAARTPDGHYRVPLAAQRPAFLMGPPGLGKTAVVAQVARRLGIGFAAYTMTHHTRQSALGLPVIVHRTLDGQSRAVTEYTMSEIVAAVWTQAEAGAEQGILFLDEINCVSEALMPAMLQLLQYKTFGVHALPRGWMIVCAGNPPKYNRYARVFDPVVLDRLRLIQVEPDLEAWKNFAVVHGVHPAVRSYLALRAEDFYASDGDHLVTARSWTDLSDMMLALEASEDVVDGALFEQYLQLPEIAERFERYHRMCLKMQTLLDDVLENGGGSVNGRFHGASFEEALFAVLMLSGRLGTLTEESARNRRRAQRLAHFVDGVRREAAGGAERLTDICQAHLNRLEHALEVRRQTGVLSEEDALEERWQISSLRRCAGEAGAAGPAAEAIMAALENCAHAAMQPVMTSDAALQDAYEHAFDFVEQDISDPNVRLIFLNDLRVHPAVRTFIHAHLQSRFDNLWTYNDPDARATRLKSGKAPG